MDKVQAVVDFVNLMTYDFRTSDPIAGHHANLYPHPADAKKRSVDSAVREFIAAGVPPAKVVVGVPFYGRAWTDIKGEGTGLYQPGSRPTERIETNSRWALAPIKQLTVAFAFRRPSPRPLIPTAGKGYARQRISPWRTANQPSGCAAQRRHPSAISRSSFSVARPSVTA